MGQLHTLPHRSIAVCFTPVSGIDSRNQAFPSRAMSRREQVQQKNLFDHLVGAAEQRKWEADAQRLGSPYVDDQLDFRKLDHG
jgi:hypothetical protein